MAQQSPPHTYIYIFREQKVILSIAEPIVDVILLLMWKTEGSVSDYADDGGCILRVRNIWLERSVNKSRLSNYSKP